MAPASDGSSPVIPEHGNYRPSSSARALLAVTRATFLGRGKSRQVLGRIFEKLHAGPVDTQLWGVPVRLHPDGNVSERMALFCPAHFNRQVLKTIARCLAEPGSVFVDIGANAGMFSLFAARHAAAGLTVLAFEPHPGLFRRMVFNLRPQTLGRYRGEVDLRLLPLALGAQAGTVVLRSEADELGSDHIDEVGTSAEAEFQVPMATLTRALSDEAITRITLLKIDVEGYEDQILKSFFETAPRSLWPRDFIIEHISAPDWRWDCIGECQVRGYELTVLSRTNSLLSLGGDLR